ATVRCARSARDRTPIRLRCRAEGRLPRGRTWPDERSGSCRFTLESGAPRLQLISWLQARILRYIYPLVEGGIMALFLKESDVEQLATMETALQAVEEAFRLQG